jgi:hypothetical protein
MSKKQTPHKYYFLLICGVMCLLIMAVYKFKLAYTIDMMHQLTEAEVTSQRSLDSHQRLAELKMRAGDVHMKNEEKISHEALPQLFLQKMNAFTQNNSVELTGLSEVSITPYGSYDVLSLSAVLNGGYMDIIRTLKEFEDHGEPMRLASVKFQSTMNRQTKRKQLNAYLHVQYLSQHN